MELGTAAPRVDDGRSAPLNVVAKSQLLILFWTVRTLGLPLRAEVVFFQRELVASLMILVRKPDPVVDCSWGMTS